MKTSAPYSNRRTGLSLLALALAAAVLVPAGARATVVDLSGPAGSVRIDGQAARDQAGLRVAGAGDVNGDGKPDFVVAAPFASNNARARSGSAYVIYGGQDLASVHLENLGSSGFRIDGAAAGDHAGTAVAGAGDVNGDGLADVVVGAPAASSNARQQSGSAYVIYGQRTADPADVDLADITTTQAARGFRIDGATAADAAGTSVAFADLNDDGLQDVVVGAPLASNNGRAVAGSVSVIYGQPLADPDDVDLATITATQAARGMRIDGAAAGDTAGNSVTAGGDLNGDGAPDLIVGAPNADNHVRNAAGSAYVIYGQRIADPTDLDLANLTTTQDARGMRIDGAAAGDTAGFSIAGGGDLNHDGIDDAIVGAYTAANNGRTESGSAYVLYGQRTADPADVDLATITTTQAARGYRIDGAAATDTAGFSVAGGRDLNGDGIADAIVAAPGASNNARSASGSAYVIYGQTSADPADLNLADIGATPSPRGLRIDGPASFDLAGYSVTDAGDLNGDRHPDAIVGAPGVGPTGTSAGAAYVVDLAAPDTAIDSAPSLTRDPTPTFTFHGTEPGSFRCSIDTATSLAPCSGPGSSHTPPRALADGTHTFRVAEVDRAGNIDSTPATRTFTVDTTPPTTTITRHPNTTITRHPKKVLKLKRRHRTVTVTFRFASSEPGSTFHCRLDHGRYRRCTSPISLKLKNGRHKFSVIATDTIGNTDPTPATFTLVVKGTTHR